MCHWWCTIHKIQTQRDLLTGIMTFSFLLAFYYLSTLRFLLCTLEILRKNSLFLEIINYVFVYLWIVWRKQLFELKWRDVLVEVDWWDRWETSRCKTTQRQAHLVDLWCQQYLFPVFFNPSCPFLTTVYSAKFFWCTYLKCQETNPLSLKISFWTTWKSVLKFSVSISNNQVFKTAEPSTSLTNKSGWTPM